MDMEWLFHRPEEEAGGGLMQRRPSKKILRIFEGINWDLCLFTEIMTIMAPIVEEEM